MGPVLRGLRGTPWGPAGTPWDPHFGGPRGSQGVPRGSPGGPKRALPESAFFGENPILGHFSEVILNLNRPKSTYKGTTGIEIDPFLKGFWAHFGAQNRPLGTPRGPPKNGQNGPKWPFWPFWAGNLGTPTISNFGIFRDGFSLTRPRAHPKMSLRSTKDRSLTLLASQAAEMVPSVERASWRRLPPGPRREGRSDPP